MSSVSYELREFFGVGQVLANKRYDAGRHLTVDGLIEIARIAETMNRKKPRHDLIRILRGHTPDVQDTGR
jgi:phosphohistidine phosphatase SixA